MIALVVVATLAALTVASLGLAHVLPAWGILFFYVVPGLFFAGWTLIELYPRGWRRLTARLRRRWRQSPLTSDRTAAPPPPRPHVHGEPWLFAASLGWFMRAMRRVLSARREPWVSRPLNVCFGAATVAIAVLAVRELASSDWSVPSGSARPIAAAGAFFLSAAALKALGWQRLFRPGERPPSLALAAATGAASVAGLALPGRFDDAVRLAVLRRASRRAPATGTLVLSLFLLGMLDAAALAPFAVVAAVAVGGSAALRAGLIVVAAAGGAAGVLAVNVPWTRRSERVHRFRAGHWLATHAPDSRREIAWAVGLVTLSWLARLSGIFVLLGALAGHSSFPLACAFLAGGAASAALPMAPAGAATQAGVGAAVLIAAGVATSAAVAVAIFTQALSVLAGVAVVLLAGGLRGAASVAARVNAT